MNKSDLIKKLLEKKDSLTEDDLEKSTNTILNFLSDTLFKGDRVEIRNFGTFFGNPFFQTIFTLFLEFFSNLGTNSFWFLLYLG